MNQDEFRHELLRVTRSAQAFMHEIMSPICKKNGITMQQFYILTELTAEPEQTVSQLSERVGILRTNFPQVCHRMEEMGLVERHHNKADRRSYLLRVTKKGHALNATIEKDVSQKYQERLGEEPEETFDTIIKGFNALTSLIENKKQGQRI